MCFTIMRGEHLAGVWKSRFRSGYWLDVSTEYRDALRLKELEMMGGVLNQTQITEQLKISNQYDLQ